MIKVFDRNMRRRMSVIMMCSLGAMASSCVSLLPDAEPADIIYRLKTDVPTKLPLTGAPVIRIDRPTVGAELRGTDISLYGIQTQVTRASGAVWSSDVPTIIQRSLFDVISGREKLIGVLPNSGARPTYRISVNVRSFEANFDKTKAFAPMVISHYSAVLSDGSSRKLISTFDVRKEERASAVRVSEIVKTQSEVNQQALDAIADWLETTLWSLKSAPKPIQTAENRTEG